MMKLLLHVLVMSVLICAAQGHSCPDGWILYYGNCYGFGQAKLTWAGALAVCRAYDGTLVEPRSSSENTWLKQQVRARRMWGAWIGASDIFNEGGFEWLSDKSHLTFTDYVVEGPNDGGGSEECLHFWGEREYRWNDITCHSKMNFVCQKKPDYSDHHK